jgi:hypothetical protein
MRAQFSDYSELNILTESSCYIVSRCRADKPYIHPFFYLHLLSSNMYILFNKLRTSFIQGMWSNWKGAPTLPDIGVRTQDVRRADASSSRAVSNSFCSANSFTCSIYTRYQTSTAFKQGMWSNWKRRPGPTGLQVLL